MMPLLTVRDLRVSYRLAQKIIALNAVSLDIMPQQAVGLLGESGCGKSTLASTLVGCLPEQASASGIINFAGLALLTARESQLRKIRGARISYIAQDPLEALSPVLKVGEQIADVLRAHQNIDRRSRRAAVDHALDEVGLDPELYDAYPHQLSGGQRQRIAIAQALICRPELVIADEPTTALDTTTQADILALIKRLREQYGLALLLISHDPAVVLEMVEYVYVMRAGEIVEQGEATKLLNMARAEYTRSLLDSTPRLAYTNAL
jgi:ABC-type glutathione transport system ATPase component